MIRKIKDTLLQNWRETPGNVIGVSLLSLWMLWTSRILFITATRPITAVFAHGPGAVLPTIVWAYIFLCFGLLRVTELFVRARWITFLLQTATSVPVIVWATCWMFGVASPGLPAYAFVALVSISLPFVTKMNRDSYYLRRAASSLREAS